MSREIDEMTYNLYVDCGLSSFETARQSGVTQQTVRSRVRRHVRRQYCQQCGRRECVDHSPPARTS